MILVLILIAGLCLAYANGANDNFKGVATLFGSGTANYRRALWWATISTLCGSLAALLLAAPLIEQFGGRGLVEDTIACQPAFAAAVALGAGLTVLIAARIGMPISTTHSLIGALIGTALSKGSTLNVGNLGANFILPLLVSPILAVAMTIMIYPVLRFVRLRLGVTRDICLCLGKETIEIVPADCHAIALERAEFLTTTLGTSIACESRYQGRVLGVSAGEALDKLHFLSSGIVSFSRGLNDTPKIAAPLLLTPAFGPATSIVVIGLVIAIGGLISASRVADTMSRKITTLNHGQGLTANLITGLIVIGASGLGFPVSTTHVSCGSLFGIGAVSGAASKTTIAAILAAWLITLPLAATLAAVIFWLVNLV
jgi:PiT family inorganic phosphate transporter